MKRLKYTPNAMKIKPLKADIDKFLKKHQLGKKFRKAQELFEQNINHPSLNVEILEPKHLKVYSFKLDKKYQAIFVVKANEIEIITVTNHYK